MRHVVIKWFYFGLVVVATVAVHADLALEPKNIVVATHDIFDPAALDLKCNLEAVTGCEIPIVYKSEIPDGAFPFMVGEAAPGAPVEFEPEEGRWRATKKGVFFYGDKTRRSRTSGVRHAVMDFLENELEVRWPWFTNIACRTQNPLVLRHGGANVKFKLRERSIRMTAKSGPLADSAAVWLARQGAGGHDIMRRGHAFTKYWERFKEDHLDYFRMVNGSRIATGRSDDDMSALGRAVNGVHVSMCVSNEALVDQVIEDWKEDGCPDWVNVCENDVPGSDACECEACQALDPPEVRGRKKEGWVNWYADRYLDFARRVLEKARKENPNVKVAMYAYNATEQPPVRLSVPDGVALALVPTVFTREWTDAFLAGWEKAGLKEFAWRPNRHHYYEMPFLPLGSEKFFFEEARRVMSHSGCVGFDYDTKAPMSAFEYYRDYPLLKAMIDPSKDFDYWDSRYCDAFGEAKENVRAYYRYWREKVWEKRIAPDLVRLSAGFSVWRGIVRNLEKYYKLSDFAAAARPLDAALLKKNLSDADRARVAELVMWNEHAKLFFKAITRKSDPDSLKLYRFRSQHGIPLFPWYEQYRGRDLCGLKKIAEKAGGNADDADAEVRGPKVRLQRNADDDKGKRRRRSR